MDKERADFYQWICSLLRVDPMRPEKLTPVEALRRLLDYVEHEYINPDLRGAALRARMAAVSRYKASKVSDSDIIKRFV